MYCNGSKGFVSFDQCDNNLTLVLAVGGVSVVSGIA